MLNKSRNKDFGPFSHGLQNIDTPPAILLGLVNPNTGEVMFMEDFGFDLPRFKVRDANLKGFRVSVEDAVKEKLTLRWWAIPALEQKIQEG